MLCKPFILITLLSMAATAIIAQSSDLSLISSGGNLGQSGSLTLSYSIGEPCISQTQTGSYWLTEGFQQPGKINLTSVDGYETQGYSYRIFPNPATGELHIESKDAMLFHLVQITNVLGQPMITEPILAEQSIVLQLNYLRPGLYFLNILDQSSNAITQPFIKL